MKAVGPQSTGLGLKHSATRLGRPLSFDAEKALEAALQVFWKKGYEGASLADLTRAMRIERPSLYAAFGNKEALFRKVLDLYAGRVGAFVTGFLNEPTARGAVERLLLHNAEALTSACNPAGCLMVQGALSGGDDSKRVCGELNRRRGEAETALRKRLERAKGEGDLPSDSNTADLARYIFTVNQGMAVQAKAGASRAQLRRIAQTALLAWPASSRK